MRCPNCGVENDGGARFCSNCGHAFAAAAGADAGEATPPGEPTVPTTPVGAKPTQPVAPAGGEQTQPVLPPTPSKVMMTPAPPEAPPPPGAPAPGAGGAAKRPSPAVLAIGGALAVVVLGLIVWAVFLREDDPAAVTLPTPTAAPTGQSQPTGSAGTTGTTGVTGVTGTVTGTTGTTGATGATGGAFSIEVQLCESVTDEGGCTNSYPFDPAAGWTIPVTAPSFTVLVTTEGLQPGDVISIDFRDVLRNNRSYYTEDFDAAPEEVVDYEQWIYWLPLVTPQTGSFPSGSTTELVVTHNGTPIEFQGPNVYTFS